MAGPKSRQDQVCELSKVLRSGGLQPHDIHTLEHIEHRVNHSLDAGRLRAVVCVGGDGTATAVVNRTRPETPLALLPRGTENLLAKYIRQPFDPVGVGKMILAGHTAQFDVGRANGKLFLLMLSAGFDADVVHRMAAGRKGHITHWSWAKPIWESLRSYQYPELRIYWRRPAVGEKFAASVDGSSGAGTEGPGTEGPGTEGPCPPEETAPTGDTETLARWAFVSNLPCYARGLPIAPDANGNDGLLDVCAYNGGTVVAAFKFLVHAMFRRHHRLSDCRMLRSDQFRLESDRPVPYQIDGDPGGWLPVNIEIIPRRMQLIVPQEFVSNA